jgi:hypothetical protein
MRRITAIILVLLFFSGGCSPQLQILMRINSEDKAIKQQLKIQEKKFDILLEDIKRGALKAGASKDYIISRYGQPILEIPKRDSTETVALLYRYPTDYFGATKVYLYCDAAGKLLRWDILER